MNTYLTKELLYYEVPTWEWYSVLSSVLPHQQSSEIMEIRYYEKQPITEEEKEKFSLKVIHYKNGRLEKIEPGPDFSTELKNQIIFTVKDRLIDNQTDKIARLILFSEIPVEEYWKYSNKIQIMPIQENAPKAPFLASKHPFIVEIPISTSKYSRISIARFEELRKQWCYFLNLLLEGGISKLGKSTSHHWVSFEGKTKFAAVHYDVDNFEPIVNEFSHCENVKPMTVAPVDGYYNNRARNHKTLRVSAWLEMLIESISSLGREDYNLLLRSCYWLYKSDRIYSDSQSAALTVKKIVCSSIVILIAWSNFCQSSREIT